MANWNVNQEFVTYPPATQPSAPVLAQNVNRKFLQVSNNGTSSAIRIKFSNNFSVPTNQVDNISFNGTPNSGTWTITDWLGNVSSALSATETAVNLQTAINALAAVSAFGSVVVTGSMTTGFTVTFSGTGLANLPIPSPGLTVQSSMTNTTVETNAVQVINWSAAPTSGTFKLQDWLGNQTGALNYNASGATIETALNALAAINNGVSSVVVGTSTITITYGAGALEYTVVPLISVVANTLTNNTTLQSGVQVFYVLPQPLQGTYALQYGGQVTAQLAYNATAMQIQTALQALSTIGAGNCEVAGVSLSEGFFVTFTGSLANSFVTLISVFNGEYNQGKQDWGQTPGELFPDVFVAPQKRGPAGGCSIFVDVVTPGIGPVSVTDTVVTTTVGVPAAAVAASIVVTIPGVAPVIDGVVVNPGVPLVYDYEVPVGAMYMIGDATGIPVQVLEGV